MVEMNLLPTLFPFNVTKKPPTRGISPVNKSLQIAMTGFNSKIYDIRKKKVKENRVKNRKSLGNTCYN
jgi:hypothetical protein